MQEHPRTFEEKGAGGSFEIESGLILYQATLLFLTRSSEALETRFQRHSLTKIRNLPYGALLDLVAFAFPGRWPRCSLEPNDAPFGIYLRGPGKMVVDIHGTNEDGRY